MLRIRLDWEHNLPDFDPELHDPDRIFAFLTYRGVHYAKWVDLKIHFGNKHWKIKSQYQHKTSSL